MTGKRYLKANAQQGVELQGQVVAEVTEARDAGLVGGNGWGNRLLSLAVDEVTEVESPRG